jgi:hypothetical protein
VRPAAGGHIAAAYLLELNADGASFPELMQAAAAIDYYYRRARTYLDPLPIDAALALVRAQTAPDRILN